MPASRHTDEPSARDDAREPDDAADAVGTDSANPVERAVEAVDAMVADEDNAANRLGVRTSRLLPWVGILLAGCAVLLVPWTIWLLIDLPSRQLSPNYDIAWAGFDLMLLVALAATAVSVLRRSRWMVMTGGWAAGLLVTDAWFDTITSPPGEVWAAVLLSVLVELPLAAVCAWVAMHATHIAEQRARVVLRALRLRR